MNRMFWKLFSSGLRRGAQQQNLTMTNAMSKIILIIDDEPDVVEVVAIRLRSKGYQTLFALDGQEGLRLAQQVHPALIILDFSLPKLPGKEVCRAIREDNDNAFSRTPIIMITGKGDDIDEVIMHVLGANYYLHKPFELEVFLSKVKELLDEE